MTEEEVTTRVARVLKELGEGALVLGVERNGIGPFAFDVTLSREGGDPLTFTVVHGARGTADSLREQVAANLPSST